MQFKVGRNPADYQNIPDDAGHVIANSLGGHGDLKQPLNIWPEHVQLNTGTIGKWVASEKAARDGLKEGHSVCVQIAFTYPKATDNWPAARPTHYRYRVWWSGILKVDNSEPNPLHVNGK